MSERMKRFVPMRITLVVFVIGIAWTFSGRDSSSTASAQAAQRPRPTATHSTAINPAMLGRWEQEMSNCSDPPDYALTISRASFTSFAHSCTFTQRNLYPNAIKGRMSCDYFGEVRAPPRGIFDMTIELTGSRKLRFGDTGGELIRYHKCG